MHTKLEINRICKGVWVTLPREHLEALAEQAAEAVDLRRAVRVLFESGDVPDPVRELAERIAREEREAGRG